MGADALHIPAHGSSGSSLTHTQAQTHTVEFYMQGSMLDRVPNK